MNSAFYIAMLIGVTWLCVWCALPEAQRRRYWSPFDYEEGGARPAKAEPAPRGAWRARPAPEVATPGSGQGWRARVVRRAGRSRERARPPAPGRRG